MDVMSIILRKENRNNNEIFQIIDSLSKWNVEEVYFNQRNG